MSAPSSSQDQVVEGGARFRLASQNIIPGAGLHPFHCRSCQSSPSHDVRLLGLGEPPLPPGASANLAMATWTLLVSSIRELILHHGGVPPPYFCASPPIHFPPGQLRLELPDPDVPGDVGEGLQRRCAVGMDGQLVTTAWAASVRARAPEAWPRPGSGSRR